MTTSERACPDCKQGQNFVPCGTLPPLTGMNVACETCKGSGLRPGLEELRDPKMARYRAIYDRVTSFSTNASRLLDEFRAEVINAD